MEEDEASCKWRRAPIVNLSDGEPLLLSYSYIWPGIRAFSFTHSLGYSSLPSETDGGLSYYMTAKISQNCGGEIIAPMMFTLGPVPSPGVISLHNTKLQGYLMTGVRLPSGPPTEGDPNSVSSTRPSRGGKVAGGAFYAGYPASNRD